MKELTSLVLRSLITSQIVCTSFTHYSRTDRRKVGYVHNDNSLSYLWLDRFATEIKGEGYERYEWEAVSHRGRCLLLSIFHHLSLLSEGSLRFSMSIDHHHQFLTRYGDPSFSCFFAVTGDRSFFPQHTPPYRDNLRSVPYTTRSHYSSLLPITTGPTSLRSGPGVRRWVGNEW